MQGRIGSIRLALAMLIAVGSLVTQHLTAHLDGVSQAQASMQVVVFRQGENGYTGCSDVRISEENPHTNFGEDELVLGMRGRARVLIRFDVSSLPTTAVVQEAYLTLVVSNYGQRAQNSIITAAYPVTRTWEEMHATWYRASHTDYWGLPGCGDIGSDRSPVALDTVAIHELGAYTWTVTSAVQYWIQSPAKNKGIVIIQTNLETGGEYDIWSSESNLGARPSLTVRYVLATPTPTHTVTHTPTQTSTVTATPSHTPTSTATLPSTSTPTATETPTATPSQAPTETAIPTYTPTWTPTRTATSQPSPSATTTATKTITPTTTRLPAENRLYLPIVVRRFPMRCLTWGYTFREEFDSPSLLGWSQSLAGGQQQVSGSIIHLWTAPSADRFPVIWRNDLFTGEDFAMEARFRHSDFTAYGTTIALNSANYGGSRVPAGQPLPTGIEDILSIHHVVDPVGGVYRFDISMLSGMVKWIGPPGDSDWHVVRVTLEQGDIYTLYVDGQRVGAVQSTLRPQSIYIGNPTIQLFSGAWTHVYVDYVYISRCTTWGPY